MSVTRSTLQKLRLMALLAVGSALAGGLYSVTRTPPGVSSVLQAASGATIGAVISSCILVFELFASAAVLAASSGRSPFSAMR